MCPRSDRPRSLRELRPDLFVASRRHRARDAAQRARGALLRFFGRLVRQQGEDWRATCDDLRKQLAAAKREADDSAREVRTLRRAVQVADAAARHADGERDDALRVSARWEIEAADLRDQLTEALALLESERAAWREERAGMVRERQVFADAIHKVKMMVSAACLPVAASPAVWSERRKRGEAIAVVYDIGLATDRASWALADAADPDPRQGTPGGADLLVHVLCMLGRCAECVGYKCRHDCHRAAVPPPPPAAPEVQPLPQRAPDLSRYPRCVERDCPENRIVGRLVCAKHAGCAS